MYEKMRYYRVALKKQKQEIERLQKFERMWLSNIDGWLWSDMGYILITFLKNKIKKYANIK